MNSTVFFAHVSPTGEPHSLNEHLLGVARLAAEFASCFNGSEWAGLGGRWHDLGKFRPGFQRYVRLSGGADAHIEGKVGGREKTHSAAGALWAIQTLGQKHGPNGALAARVFAYLIASHHAGLYDWAGGLDHRLADADSQTELKEALAALPDEDILSAGSFVPDLRSLPGGSAGFALWVRMLFSCLVDADFLDTEAFFNTALPQARVGFPAIEVLHETFEQHMNALAARASPTKVNVLRAQVLRQCQDKASMPPGFFSLTVPTGGGKTLSSLAFALRHAVGHGKRRIVYAIPYTSIIEQTADVFRDVFKPLGDEVLIEHHSQAESDDKSETGRSRLACENWDAPLIVTTNVQLFESLFAAKTSRCRKLHNLANSVIVLDEAQQLPPGFLQPILDVLNLLVKHYGVTVVLCTATQPALASTRYFDASRNLRGLDDVREIIDDPEALYAALKRVEVRLPEDWNAQMSWDAVAAELTAEDCVLAIVNTRKAARELHRLMPKGTIHLSALMCGAHRAAVIQQIKDRLKARREGRTSEPLRVVSTQLVEAGVDLDFPVVWRALAGLDSIAQAAGRCNREGSLNGKGRVVVFIPPEQLPMGLLRTGGQECESVLSHGAQDALQLELIGTYFRKLYAATELDKESVCQLLRLDANADDEAKILRAVFGNLLDTKIMPKAIARASGYLMIDFKTAAEKFRLIEDEHTQPVVVRYAQARDTLEMLLATLSTDGPQRWLMRKLQRYTINLNRWHVDRLLGCGLSEPIPGLYVQDVDGLYDDELGFLFDAVPFNPSGYFS